MQIVSIMMKVYGKIRLLECGILHHFVYLVHCHFQFPIICISLVFHTCMLW